MKKILWIMAILILLWLGFLFILKNPSLSISQEIFKTLNMEQFLSWDNQILSGEILSGENLSWTEVQNQLIFEKNRYFIIPEGDCSTESGKYLIFDNHDYSKPLAEYYFGDDHYQTLGLDLDYNYFTATWFFVTQTVDWDLLGDWEINLYEISLDGKIKFVTNIVNEKSNDKISIWEIDNNMILDSNRKKFAWFDTPDDENYRISLFDIESKLTKRFYFPIDKDKWDMIVSILRLDNSIATIQVDFCCCDAPSCAENTRIVKVDLESEKIVSPYKKYMESEYYKEMIEIQNKSRLKVVWGSSYDQEIPEIYIDGIRITSSNSAISERLHNIKEINNDTLVFREKKDKNCDDYFYTSIPISEVFKK